jgi:MFS family permease
MMMRVPIEAFYLARFMQGFSFSVSSVMSLIIIRDCYQEAHHRSRMHALINMSLSLSPITGALLVLVPLVNAHWHNAFIVITSIYVVMLFLVQYIYLAPNTMGTDSLLKQCGAILAAPNTIKSILLIGMSIGFARCYFSMMIPILDRLVGEDFIIIIGGQTFKLFQLSLFGVSASWLLGGYMAGWCSKNYGQKLSIYFGAIWVTIYCSMLFFTTLQAHTHLPYFMIGCSIFTMIGTGVIIPNAMALAMEGHQSRAGVAGSIIGFGFYTVSALMQFSLTWLPTHNMMSMPGLFMLSALVILGIAHSYQNASIEGADETVEGFDESAQSLDVILDIDNSYQNSSTEAVDKTVENFDEPAQSLDE